MLAAATPSATQFFVQSVESSKYQPPVLPDFEKLLPPAGAAILPQAQMVVNVGGETLQQIAQLPRQLNLQFRGPRGEVIASRAYLTK